MGNRLKTCYYRFNAILDARDKHFYQGNISNPLGP
jgi:hypothetical protein